MAPNEILHGEFMAIVSVTNTESKERHSLDILKKIQQGLIFFMLSILCLTLTACENKKELERKKEQETAKKMMEYKP